MDDQPRRAELIEIVDNLGFAEDLCEAISEGAHPPAAAVATHAAGRIRFAIQELKSLYRNGGDE